MTQNLTTGLLYTKLCGAMQHLIKATGSKHWTVKFCLSNCSYSTTTAINSCTGPLLKANLSQLRCNHPFHAISKLRHARVPFLPSSNCLSFCESKRRTDMKRQDMGVGTTETDSPVSVLAQEIVDATSKVDIRAASLQIQTIKDLLEQLAEIGFDPALAADLLSGQIGLLRDPPGVYEVAHLITQHGMPSQVVVSLLEQLPVEYRLGDESLANVPRLVDESLLQLRALGFSEQILSSMAVKDPSILLLKPQSLRSAMTKLKGLFTAADALHVARTCPQVFSRPWEETNALFDYAFFTMGYPHSQIVSSGTLACSLSLLQERHIFLVRAGQFVTVKAKDNPRLNPNPPLSQLVKTSDGKFARQFGGVSGREYSAFLAMREMELELEDDDDTDSDETDD